MPVPTANDPNNTVGILFDVLSNARRRMIVRLLSADSPRTLKVLTGRITIIEKELDERDPLAVPSKERNSIHVTLYQNHVPALVETSVCEFDQREKTVHRGDIFSKAETVLQVADQVS